MLRLPALFIAFASLACAGCTAVDRVRSDQDRIRQTLLDLYTHQVMDNLVRAYNGLPIIQLDYTNASAQVTFDVNGGVNDSLATSTSNTLSGLALASTVVTRSLMNTLSGNLGLSHTNQVGITASPVINSNETYDAYLRFLAEPGSFQVSDCPPPPGAAHISMEFCKKHYWVPCEFRSLFFELASITTTQRGKALKAPDLYYTVRVLGFTDKEQINAKPSNKGVYQVKVKVDRLLPSDTGTMELSDGTRLSIISVDTDDKLKTRNLEVDSWQVDVNPKKNPNGPLTPSDLTFPMSVKFYLADNKPYLQPTTKELLDRIPFQTPQVSLDPPADADSAIGDSGAAAPEILPTPRQADEKKALPASPSAP